MLNLFDWAREKFQILASLSKISNLHQSRQMIYWKNATKKRIPVLPIIVTVVVVVGVVV